MRHGTYLDIDLGKIRENSRRVKDLCDEQGIEVLGVTKGFSAIPDIVQAMSDGGIEKFADSRMENIAALRAAGFRQEMTLLRIPMFSQAEYVVRYAECSLNSELSVIKELHREALRQDKCHNVILMVDIGDLREGVMPEDADVTVRSILELEGVRLAGIGTNMGCFGGILPTEKNLSNLVALSADLEKKTGLPMSTVSGGGTSSLLLVKEHRMPAGITQLRIGEGILLGTDSTHDSAIPWLLQDAFRLSSEIVEIKEKPSVPIGEIGKDAFGNTPHFEDKGIRRRAIVAIGRQDTPPNGITPVDPGINILGASSDHMILDISDTQQTYHVGDQIGFRLSYHGLLSMCNSDYIYRHYRNTQYPQS